MIEIGALDQPHPPLVKLMVVPDCVIERIRHDDGASFVHQGKPGNSPVPAQTVVVEGDVEVARPNANTIEKADK